MGISQSTSEQTLKAATVVMYATRYCPYCIRARQLLQAKSISIKEIDVDSDPTLWQTMTERSGRETVPQIFIDGLHIGGYDDMAALERAGKLDALLFNSMPSEGLDT